MVYKDKAKQNEACRLAGIRYRERKKQNGFVRTWVQVPERKEEANQETAVQATPEMPTETNSLNPERNTKKVTHEYSC